MKKMNRLFSKSKLYTEANIEKYGWRVKKSVWKKHKAATADGSSLSISPAKDSKREMKFSQALEKINKENARTLRTLAT
jgi:hypothetical protein